MSLLGAWNAPTAADPSCPPSLLSGPWPFIAMTAFTDERDLDHSVSAEVRMRCLRGRLACDEEQDAAPGG
jgi:hypothetical protein